MRKNEKAITLIALIITIVILLILAGVAISQITGENGLFSSAKKAKVQTEYTSAKEIINMKLMEIQTECTTQEKAYNIKQIAQSMKESTEITIEKIYNKETASLKQGVVLDSNIANLESIIVSVDKYSKYKFLIGETGEIEGATDKEITETTSKKEFEEVTKFEEKFKTTSKNENNKEDIIEKEPEITVTEPIISKNTNATSSDEPYSVEKGTPVYIKFTATINIENGTCTIDKEVPYQVSENGTYTFTITGTYGDNKTLKKEIAVNVKQYRDVVSNINKVLSTTDNTELKDAKGNKIVIPAGFKIVLDSTTNNAQIVDQGIVIEDATETATKGSQFVWIPVGTITKADGTTETINLNRYTFDDNGNETAQNDVAINNYYQELETSDEENTVAKSIPNFKTSVSQNGGYYIGRYEARTATERTGEGQSLTQITEKGTEYVYNYVTQPQAAQLSRNMYNSTKFTSDLMNSYAWDTAILFLQKCGTNSKYSRQISLNTDLANRGTNNSDIKDIQCNVYDMASNIYEWSTESITDSAKGDSISRGGRYPANFFASSRVNKGIISESVHDGFRPILYLE